jgi:hypothetical protein
MKVFLSESSESKSMEMTGQEMLPIQHQTQQKNSHSKDLK